VKILLDTHAFLWLIAGDASLSPKARDIIEAADNEPLLSAASLWEMAIKVSLGKLTLNFEEPFSEAIGGQLRLKGRQQIPTLVSVPDSEEAESPDRPELVDKTETKTATTRHTEIQHDLMTIGADMGFDIWVARNDRSRSWNGKELGKLPNVIDELPTQFNEVTNRTIELIDVLWLKGNSVVAAFTTGRSGARLSWTPSTSRLRPFTGWTTS